MRIYLKKEFSNFGSKKIIHLNWVIPLGIFLLFVGVYYLSNRYIWDTVSQTQDTIFGSDTMETLENIQKISFNDDTKKHMLFSATLSPISKSIQEVLGISQNKSIRLTLAIMASLNIAGVFLFFRKFSSSILLSLLFVVFYSLCFSNFVIYSIPETYSVSNLFILIYIGTIIALRKPLTVYSSMLLSVIAGIASLYNPVLLSLIVIQIAMIFFQRDWKHWVMISLSNLTIGTIIYFFVGYLMFATQFFDFVTSYANRYASLNNYLDIKSISNVFSNFYFFSILSPHHYLSASLELNDWLGYGDSFLTIIVIILIGIFLLYGIFVLVTNKSKNREFVLTLFLWTVLLALFYVYFNPKEAILYSSQVLLPLLIIFIHAFKTIKWKLPLKYAIFIFCLLVITHTNVTAFLNGVR